MRGNERAVHVATVSQDRLDRGSSVTLVEETLERLDRAAYREPDIVCLPETFSGYEAEPAPGPITERLSGWARGRSCYVICPMRTEVAGRTFNSAIILDRRGEMVGRYDKIHLTEGELAGGVAAGEADPPVFQTDFGTIGVQICFDVNWPESWRRLKEKGAEIVFYPSAFPAHRQVSSLAWRNEFHIVSAWRSLGWCRCGPTWPAVRRLWTMREGDPATPVLTRNAIRAFWRLLGMSRSHLTWTGCPIAT